MRNGLGVVEDCGSIAASGCAAGISGLTILMVTVIVHNNFIKHSTCIGSVCQKHIVHIVHIPLDAAGRRSMLKAGIAALPADADGVLVCLGDMPLTGSDVLNALITAFIEAPGETICVPTFEGKNGNPVLWPKSCFSQIMELEGDVGARSLIGQHADQVNPVAVDTRSILVDVDTKRELLGLNERPG